MKAITHTILENYTNKDPLYLQHLLFDLPFDLEQTDYLEIIITIPRKKQVFVIDDLHFEFTKKNTLTFILEEHAKLEYQLFVANHQLCAQCVDRKRYDCQAIPADFEKKIHLRMTGKFADASIRCHYLGERSDQLRLKTIQYHAASQTSSSVVIKGVLDEKAQLRSDNLIQVPNDLHDVHAVQQNNNLILNEHAHAISIPKLEIQSQHVNCKHGASTTGLNQEHLFYLQSRGSSFEEAKTEIVKSFLSRNYSDDIENI